MNDRGDSNVRAADLAVSRKMVDRSTADRALHLLDARDSQISLGELLLQLGHINADQFKELMAAHHASALPADTAINESQLFGEAVISRGLATPDQVNDALREQAELAGKGTFKNLGELLIVKKILTSDQVKGLIHEQDQVIMLCPSCGEKYNVLKQWMGKAKCPSDSSLLAEIQTSASVGVAATLGAGGDTPGSPIGMEAGGCRIVELIGRGSMGAVYKAKHVGLNRYVAVKLLPSVSNDPELVKRLLFEARAIAKLEHPNIVQVYDVGFQRGYFFIVMQLLKGETLEERVAEMGALPVPTALDIITDVAQGLAAAHAKGIVHRDLKPANIMLTEDGKARLTDFGLAQDAENPDGREGLIVGTPYYMSPEQWLGHKADERSDLYSLGVILYQMVTGHRAFAGETVNELMHQHLKVVAPSPKHYDPELADGLCAMIKKMISKPPKKRYPNVPEFLDDLKKVSTGEDPDALAEFGQMVKCQFCETFNAVTEKKCKICGENMGDAAGPIEIAAHPDEFKCPGCGALNRKGTRVCGGCRKHFCTRCKIRVAVLRSYCHRCVPHLRR
ncbi:MAG TPA: serine/threonine-protein kinase [Planctomycetota bacterium]|nr:serine/threonine-protein kinase [Planctomycetota bacterium]